MIMEELYHLMRDALVHFGLRLKDMDKVQVEFIKCGVRFSYDTMEITYRKENK